jgi:DNA-binding MarR family transcriptional regulator
VDRYVGYALKEAQHSLRIRLDDALRPLGLTAPQYAALAVMANEPGISGAHLARRCFVTAQTMNGIIANLESAGLIKRRPAPDHGRILQATLTESGAALLGRATRAGEAIEAAMLEGIAAEDRNRLLELLRRCCRNLQAPD